MNQNSPTERRARTRGDAGSVLTLQELEQVRLLLRGGSVIDWVRLNLEHPRQVSAFIRRQEIDLDDEDDRLRVDRVKQGALEYLARIEVDVSLACEHDLPQLLLSASTNGDDRQAACAILKTMHIVHHIEARALRYRLALSEQRIAELLNKKTQSFAENLKATGFPLSSFDGGEKERTSVITKLLVKREHHAAQIHDRVRFRFIVDRESDLIPFLARITNELLPFNYIMPDKSVNLLVNFSALTESHQAYRRAAEHLQVDLGLEESRIHAMNEFSGTSYRAINFIADVPLRIPDTLMQNDDGTLGRVIFALAEFQVFDRQTDLQNESGENRHELYKSRQVDVVRDRLRHGIHARKS